MLPFVATMQMFGPLETVVLGTSDPEVKRVVVLLHGFGAPGDDLVGLAELLPREKVRYVFPRAPIDLGGGRAWWMIDWEQAARYARSGDIAGYEKLVPEGMPEASAAVSTMLDAIEKHWKLSSDQVVLGGFSQGAMLSVEVAARRQKKPGALVLMSGAQKGTPRWLEQAKSLAGVKVLQSHGTADVVLPYAGGERLRDTLVAAGAKVKWVSFAGGHGIPREVLRELALFLAD